MLELKLRPPQDFTCSEAIEPFLHKVFLGEYEIPLQVAAPTILDCGANFGAFSLWASHRWPGAKIHAYEPHPRTFEYLRKNLRSYSNVTLYECAVGKPGLRPLFDGVNNEGEASLFAGNGRADTGHHVLTIDPCDMPEADILKMDVEGAELEILQRLIETGRTFKAVMFEFHHIDLRRMLDSLLADYTLVGCELNLNPGLGVCKYMHKDLVTWPNVVTP